MQSNLKVEVESLQQEAIEREDCKKTAKRLGPGPEKTRPAVWSFGF